MTMCHKTMCCVQHYKASLKAQRHIVLVFFLPIGLIKDMMTRAQVDILKHELVWQKHKTKSDIFLQVYYSYTVY
jgi:hypothetical protein